VLPRASGPLPVDLLSFGVPGWSGSPPGVLHVLLPVPSSESAPSGPADAAAARRLLRLSRRERQVLELLGTGLGTDAIASRLCISPVTVRNHLQSILHALGVHRRLEAVITLLRGRG